MNIWQRLITTQPTSLIPPASIMEHLHQVYTPIPKNQITFIIGKMHGAHKNWPILWKNAIYPHILASLSHNVGIGKWSELQQIWQSELTSHIPAFYRILESMNGSFHAFQWWLGLPLTMMNEFLYLIDNIDSSDWDNHIDAWAFLNNKKVPLHIKNKIPNDFFYHFWNRCDWSGKYPLLDTITNDQKYDITTNKPLLIWEAIVNKELAWDVSEETTAHFSWHTAANILSLGSSPFRSYAGMQSALAWLKTPEALAYIIRQYPPKKENAWLIVLKSYLGNNTENLYFKQRMKDPIEKALEHLVYNLEESHWSILDPNILDSHNVLDQIKYLNILRNGSSGSELTHETVEPINEFELFLDGDVAYSSSMDM